jgi:HAE1 family hydrophobic/amphiphilic exporter-1
MNLSDLSIRRPTFITCIVFLMLAVGWLSMKRLGVDLFPDVTFPVVTITTPYRGAGPSEIETLVSKPLEDEVSTLSGIKRLSSINREGVSVVVAEFTLETDVKYAEQQIRDRVGSAKRKLPSEIEEPIIRRIDPADQPVLTLSVTGDLPPAALFDLANEFIRPKLEQVNQVGLVEVIGGRKREIQVTLDRNQLNRREISATQVAARLGAAGENVPAGKITQGAKETVLRTLGQFSTLKDIESTIVNFFGNDTPTTIKDIGVVRDTLEDEKSRTYLNGEKSLFLLAFRQSGANTIAVVEALKKAVDKVNLELNDKPGKAKVTMIRDGSAWVKANVDDVKESIVIGIVLAVLVVFYFLGSGRSTIITGLALPNSLIGAFILMAAAGFTINIMTLLALSLSVGLLIDDAIVVRENIFRHIEMGKDPVRASREGTAEVRLAVIATTLTVIAVFGPVGFLKGVVGQFFKQFGLTICFAMAISLFDALTIAPMLSTYFAGKSHGAREKVKEGSRSIYDRTIGASLRSFDRFQTRLEKRYENLLRWTLAHPGKTLGISFLVFLVSCSTITKVPKTFLPPQDAGEFMVALDMPPGTSLDAMTELGQKVDQVIRANREVEVSAMTVGSRDGEANYLDYYVRLIPSKQRKGTTTGLIKDRIRDQLKPFANANPKVKDYDAVSGGQRPFNLNIIGTDQALLEQVAKKYFARIKDDPRLKDVDIDFRPGKPEFQIVPDKAKMQQLGISTITLGQELRTQVEGATPARFRENGVEYDVRVRVQEEQRNLIQSFGQVYVPNINFSMIKLSSVSNPKLTEGPSKITRQDRGRYININADNAPSGDLNQLLKDIDNWSKTDPELKLPAGMSYSTPGQSENFKELGDSMAVAMGLGILFIYLVLASLYESFVTPLTIMLALPLAVCGSTVALWLSNESLNIFSMIGIIMLLGVATKNSILLVDYANQQFKAGKTRAEAIIEAGRTRLRPILMTTMALVAGTVPIAMGLNEASKQRTSMGFAIIGGLVSSTLLTLIVIPAAYSFIDRFRVWSNIKMKRLFGVPEHLEGLE